jgi:hypothetical protein
LFTLPKGAEFEETPHSPSGAVFYFEVQFGLAYRYDPPRMERGDGENS